MSIKRLLAIELVKFKAPLNIVLLSIYALVLMGVSAIALKYGGSITVDANTPGNAVEGSGAGSVVRVQVMLLNLLMAVIIIFNIGREFAHGTVKKNIIDGLKRSHWILGKTLASYMVYLGIFVFGLVLYFATGTLIAGWGAAYADYGIGYITQDFFTYLYSTAFIVAVALLARNIAIGFIVFIFFSAFEYVLSLALVQITGEFQNYRLYMPSGAVGIIKSYETIDKAKLLIPAVYFVLFTVIPLVVFSRKDIK